jgi:uncharacterized protein (DUF58 family)
MPVFTNKTLYMLALGSLILFPSIEYPGLLTAFYAYIVISALLILIDYISILANFNLKITRNSEFQLSLLDANPVELELSYRGRIPLKVQLMESGLEKFILKPSILTTDLKPQSRKTLKYNITPITRGDFTFEAVHVRADSALGFITVQKIMKLPKEVRVVPSVKAIRKYNLLTRHPLRSTGERVIKQKGRSTSFKELRDYIPGDEYRSIDWKVTARRNKLTVREYEDERCQNLIIMIDTGRLMTSFVPRGKKEGATLLETDLSVEDLLPWENPLRETTRLDFTVNASLVLSYVAISKGDNVGVMAFSDREEIYLPPRSGKGQINLMVNTLYKLKPKLVESNYKAAFTKIATFQRKRSLIIFFTDLIDPESSKSLIKYLLALHPRHTPLVVAFRDAEVALLAEKETSDSAELFDISVARDILFQRELALRELRRGGAMTLDLYPEELSVNVVNEYIRLKSKAVI